MMWIESMTAKRDQSTRADQQAPGSSNFSVYNRNVIQELFSLKRTLKY